MNEKHAPENKPAPSPRQQVSPHPETQKQPKGAPGDASSKAAHRGVDGRTGHDKDANEASEPAPRR